MQCLDCGYDLRGLVTHTAAQSPTPVAISPHPAAAGHHHTHPLDPNAAFDPHAPLHATPNPDADHPTDPAPGYPEPFHCPECGRPFNPFNPETYRDTATSMRRRVRWTMRRVLPVVLIVLIVTTGITFSWIPHPAPIAPQFRIDDWRTWIWFDERYGWESISFSEQVFRWGDHVRRVQSTLPTLGPDGDPDGRTLAWEVERLDAETWALRVHDADADWARILWAWNMTRDRLFGLVMVDGPADEPGPFEFVGSEEGLLTAAVKHWNLTLKTALPRDPSGQVWIWHPTEERVMPTSRAHATELIGYDPFDPNDPAHPQYRSPRR
jgi:hypothetical protein